MEIAIDITTADLSLITSGSFMTIGEKPIQMDVLVDNETTVSVLIVFHKELHPSGKSIIRSGSADGTVDEWHIYKSADVDYGHTATPIPVMFYEEEGVSKAIYLQLHTTILPAGPLQIDFAWWDGEHDPSMKQFQF